MRLAAVLSLLAFCAIACGSPDRPVVLSRGAVRNGQGRGASSVTDDLDDGAFDGGDAEADAGADTRSYCERLGACCAGLPVWNASGTSCYDIVTGNDSSLCKRRWNALRLNGGC